MSEIQEGLRLSPQVLVALEALRGDFTKFRSMIAARPLMPFAFLEVTPKPGAASATALADRILSKGWAMAGSSTIALQPPIPWEGHLRSFEFHLHAWEPVKHCLMVFDLSRSWKYFEAAHAIACDWIAACAIKPGGQTLNATVAQVVAAEGQGSWWYDMAIGQRLQRLCYIADVCCRNPEFDDAHLAVLMDQILVHHVALVHDKIFRAATNHGFFQALNQSAALKRLPEFDHDGVLTRLTEQRLQAMVAQQYTADMVHREHSPGYHYMVTVALMNAQRANILSENLTSGLALAQANLGWMIRPSGNITPFGDTDPHLLANPTALAFFNEPSLCSTLAVAPETPHGLKVFAEAGYAFARVYAPDVKPLPAEATYLAQTATFHSRVHKHCDFLSFIWYDKGRDILIDPARHSYNGKTVVGSDLHNEGFWYSDPARIYCETTRAHNCVEIDGRNYMRRDVKPWGSALVSASEQDGLIVTDCEVTHFKAVRHRRYLVMRPGHFLVVFDWLYDRSGEPHDYAQWFHFATDWALTADARLVRAQHPGDAGRGPLDLTIASLGEGAKIGPIARAQTEPALLGWLSDRAFSLAPSSCFAINCRSSEPTRIATLFTFGRDLQVHAQQTRFNATLSAGRVAWTDEKGHYQLVLERPPDSALKVTLQTL
jgi:Heparinase II/III-like protein/Heparinase II/III N-terminus